MNFKVCASFSPWPFIRAGGGVLKISVKNGALLHQMHIYSIGNRNSSTSRASEAFRASSHYRSQASLSTGIKLEVSVFHIVRSECYLLSRKELGEILLILSWGIVAYI